jgi:hypothetical protein
MHADKNKITPNFVIPVQTGIQAGFNLANISSALLPTPSPSFLRKQESIGVYLRSSAAKIVLTLKT